jgi:hypothetical protein
MNLKQLRIVIVSADDAVKCTRLVHIWTKAVNTGQRTPWSGQNTIRDVGSHLSYIEAVFSKEMRAVDDDLLVGQIKQRIHSCSGMPPPR